MVNISQLVLKKVFIIFACIAFSWRRIILLELDEKISEAGGDNYRNKWFSPFFECVGVPWPPVIRRQALGVKNTGRRPRSGE
jgi:hypothetical protein